MASPWGLEHSGGATRCHRRAQVNAVPCRPLFRVGVPIGTGQTLSAVSAMVVLTAVMGLVATILATLEQRRQEIAILRALGARPGTIAGLLVERGAELSAQDEVGDQPLLGRVDHLLDEVEVRAIERDGRALSTL